MKRTIEVDDVLQEHVESAICDVKDLLLEYLKETIDNVDKLPCISDDLDYDGRVHEIVDGCVPIYYHEIDTAWYLYGSELEEAYEDAGVGENPKENDGMTALYFYIYDKIYEWYDQNAEEIFDEWYEKRQADE
jgi:hypothetical protein